METKIFVAEITSEIKKLNKYFTKSGIKIPLLWYNFINYHNQNNQPQ